MKSGNVQVRHTSLYPYTSRTTAYIFSVNFRENMSSKMHFHFFGKILHKCESLEIAHVRRGYGGRKFSNEPTLITVAPAPVAKGLNVRTRESPALWVTIAGDFKYNS